VSTGTVILLVIVLVIIAVVAALASTVVHRQAARRRRVGAEFGRLAREKGPRRARAEFNSRRRRVDAMGVKPLSDERRSAYERQWTAVQERFVDSPAQAATTAAGLVTAVAAERGYDVTDSNQLLVDLSVYHGQHLDGYRRATATTERAAAAATEELRQALLEHRALFQDLLAGPSGSSSASSSASRGVGAGRQAGWRQIVPSLPRPARGRDGDDRDRDDIAAARS
jgi:Tfp pilus assembly protein FimT